MKEMIEKAKQYAINAHKETNHFYDGKSYDTHLNMVFETVERFTKNYSDSSFDALKKAAWLHDVIEDCRITYNDLKNEFDQEVAELVYAVTNEKGKTRKQRANQKYYEDMKKVPNAVFLKICDRIANIEYSLYGDGKKLDMYLKEHDSFCSYIKSNVDFLRKRQEWLGECFDYLNQLVEQAGYFRNYIEKLKSLKNLISDGNDEDAESESLRDSMDIVWNKLSDLNKQKAREYSSKLNLISNCNDEDAELEQINK